MTTVDLTPGPETFRAALSAAAAVFFDYHDRVGAITYFNVETLNQLVRDMCEPAYRAGREDAAKAPEDFRLGASDFGEVFLEHAVKGCFWEVQIGGSDNGSPRMELDSVLDAAREHIRTEHNIERGSE